MKAAFISIEEMRDGMDTVEAAHQIEHQRRRNPALAIAEYYRVVKRFQQKTKWKPSDRENYEIRCDLLGRERPVGTKAIPIFK
jgi:hypothetical protein